MRSLDESKKDGTVDEEKPSVQRESCYILFFFLRLNFSLKIYRLSFFGGDGTGGQ